MITECPDCGGKLGKSAIKCRCGWTASFDQAKPAAKNQKTLARCQHDPKCPYPARLKAKDKWVCVVCYDAALRQEIRAA